MTLSINQISKHIRDREYMSGVERDSTRIKATGEVFTPTNRVQKELDKIEKIQSNSFNDTSKTFIDPGCGDGQFLGEVLIRKLEYLYKEQITDSEFEKALSTIYGVDIMIDNVDLCRKRLLCGRTDPGLIAIVEQNIQCRDALKFGYNFEPMGPARRKVEERLRKKEKKLQLKKQKEEEQRLKKEAGEKVLKKLFEKQIESKKMNKSVDPEKLIVETVETRNKIDTVKKVKLNNPKVVNKKQQTNERLISLQAQLKG